MYSVLRQPDISFAISPSTTTTTPLLHARGDEPALLPRVVRPTAGERLAAGLLSKLPHAGLELRTEVTDQTLDGPGKGLAESCNQLVCTL